MNFKTEILKSCISDHLAVMLSFQIGEKKVCNKSEKHIFKRLFNETSKELLRSRLREIKWDNLKTPSNSNLAYNELLDTFTSLYDDCFLKVKIKVKARNPSRLRIAEDIAKSSGKKRELYEKYFKNRNHKKFAT